jgi:tRNA pseudouridine55 synthase
MNPGLVIVDKPPGMTSHDVVGRCRRIFATRRVGHAGTLDPMATGVLVIGIERATKILGLVTETSKSYAATIRLGQSTSTEDAEGEITQQVSAQGVTDDAIEAAIAGLRGDIAQVPSAVSAPIDSRARATPSNWPPGRCASSGSTCWRCVAMI